MISTRTELMTSRQCLRLAYWLVLMAAAGSCAFGCARVEGNYVRGDYIVVHADAETSGTVTVEANHAPASSIWSTLISLITNLWK